MPAAGKQAAEAELDADLGTMMTPELRHLDAGETPNAAGAAAASDILGQDLTCPAPCRHEAILCCCIDSKVLSIQLALWCPPGTTVRRTG